MHNYSFILEQYRQSGNICQFLDLSGFNEFLAPEKFAALETAGFHLYNNSILELLIPSILRQIIVARCLYENRLLFNDTSYSDPDDDVIPLGQYVFSYIVPAFFAILAILFNLSMLLVTARKIVMSTVCNWLLAFDSLCQIQVMILFPVDVFATISAPFVSVNHASDFPHFPIDYRVCLTFEMLATGFSHAGFLAVYFISLERLLIVMMPMRMSQLSDKKIKYFSLLAILACVCFGVAMILIIFRIEPIMYITYGRLLICNTRMVSDVPNLYEYIRFVPKYRYVNITILCFVLLNYVLIAGLIVWRRIYMPSTQADSTNNAAHRQATYRMLRSVFIISLVVLIGWLFGVLLSAWIQLKIFDELLAKNIVQIFYTDNIIEPGTPGWPLFSNLTTYLGTMLNCLFPISAGLNAPVLFINNSDYREAYKKTLAPILKICRKRTATVAVVGVGPLFSSPDPQH